MPERKSIPSDARTKKREGNGGSGADLRGDEATTFHQEAAEVHGSEGVEREAPGGVRGPVSARNRGDPEGDVGRSRDVPSQDRGRSRRHRSERAVRPAGVAPRTVSGSKLRAARLAKDWSLREAAAAAKIGPMTLLSIERGGGLRIRTLIRLADVYEIADLNSIFIRKGGA